MIWSVVRTGWMNLRRDRAAWMLSFVVPIVFFSIFASIFGAQRRRLRVGFTPDLMERYAQTVIARTQQLLEQWPNDGEIDRFLASTTAAAGVTSVASGS